MKQPSFAVTAVLILFLAPVVRAEDWPEFRGPTGQGLVAKGELPTTWGKDKNLAWKQAIPGKGWSSPIVVGGRIYLTTAVPVKGSSDLSLEALCLDTSTGAILWEKEVFRQDGKSAPPIHSKNSHASPTPLLRGERLFVHFGHQGTACLNLKGEVIWKNISLRYIPIHGNGGSPILVEDLLVFSCDGGDQRFVAALDVGDGKVRWKTNRTLDTDRRFSFSTPLLIEVRGQKQVISPGSGGVTAYEPATGKELWWVRYNGYSVIPRPVYGHGLVFVCTGYDRPSLMAIRPDGQGDVTNTHVAWKTAKAVAHTPSLLLVGDELYMMSDFGIASCLDARTGEVHWQQRVGGNYSASPLCADSKLFFLSEQGDTTVVRAEKRFTLVAKNALGERSLASPAAAGGALFIRTDKHLYRIGDR
jgi:outer membrane protein assembly factor BamB